MTYQVRTTRRVDRQIVQIATWYSERSGSEQLATRGVLGLRTSLQKLARNPERYSLARESSAFDFELRELLDGSGRKNTHRVLFRILSEERVVEVVSLRHAAQRDLTPDDV